MNRLPVLDVLRGAAILVVFVFHYAAEVYGLDWYRWDGPWRQFAPTGGLADYALYPLTLGWSGVSLFFVLSGFVIHLGTTAAPLNRRFNAVRFFRRRFWRIYPPYLFALAAFVLMQKGGPLLTAAGRADLAAHLLLVHNFHETTFFTLNGVYWSLALEVQFYLLYPILLFSRQRLGMAATFGLTVLISLAARCYLLVTYDCPYPITVAWASLPVLWMDWVLGAYLAERYATGRKTFGRHPWAWAVGLGIVFVAATLYLPTNGFTFSLASMAWAAVVDAAVWSQRERLGVMARPVAFVGLVSYSLYLWHTPLLPAVIKRLRWAGLPDPATSPWAAVTGGVAALVILVGLSYVLYTTIERWAMTGARPVSPQRPFEQAS